MVQPGLLSRDSVGTGSDYAISDFTCIRGGLEPAPDWCMVAALLLRQGIMISRWQLTSPSLLCPPPLPPPRQISNSWSAIICLLSVSVTATQGEGDGTRRTKLLGESWRTALRGPSLSPSPDKMNDYLSGHNPRHLLLAREIRLRGPQRTQLQIRAP